MKPTLKNQKVKNTVLHAKNPVKPKMKAGLFCDEFLRIYED
jgi:hypothetical protein